MTSRRSIGWQLAWLASLTLVAACAGGAGPTSSVPAAPLAVTSTPASSAPSWKIVSISDSAFGSGNGAAAIDAYARQVSEDLGVTTSVVPFEYGGKTSDFVLDRIRTDEHLRKAVSTADVIVFDVPLGDFRSFCPFDSDNQRPIGTPDEWLACAPTAAAHNTANARQIVDELVALRSPDEALFRAMNLWEFHYRDNLGFGIETAMHQLFTLANRGVVDAAGEHGIPVVDAWTAFMGPDGRTDPVATGDLLDDQTHLSPQGTAKVAGLLRAVGYGRWGPAPSP